MAVWDLDRSPHLLVTGRTGGGKSVLLARLCREAIAQGARIECVDPKQLDYLWLEDHPAAVVHTGLDEQVDALQRLRDAVESRNRMLRGYGVKKWPDLPDEARELHPRLLVVVDEAGDLLMLSKVDKAEDERRAAAGAAMVRIAMVGRSAGVHLIVGLQRADASLLGPAGGLLRAQLAGRMVLGHGDPDGLRMMMPGFDSTALAYLLPGDVPGRALVLGIGGADTRPYLVQVYAEAPAPQSALTLAGAEGRRP